jgi:molecular chaperone DnaK
MPRTIGIDLGTTNSVMAYITRGAPRVIDNRESDSLTPSIVARGRKGELLVGTPAKGRLFVRNPGVVYSIKRFIGRKYNDPDVQRALAKMKLPYKVTAGEDGDVRVWINERVFTPPEISALVLRRLKEDAESKLSEPVTRAVITVPAYFGERQVAATREAGKMAGFRVVKIINEPTAAALSFSLDRENPEETKTILVYDLGGGTFDISIMMMVQGQLAVMGIEGDNLLGGDDFDAMIVDKMIEHLKQEYGSDIVIDEDTIRSLRPKAEETKIQLSNQLSVEIVVPNLGSEMLTLEMEITRAEFEEMIKESIGKTIELTRKAIQDANLTIDEIDYILLVGGSTKIPMVDRYLAKEFGSSKIRKDVNPMLCVAIGASIQAGMINEIECMNCHTLNSAQFAECQNCHQSLEEELKVICPSCYALHSINLDQCEKCGAGLKEAAAVVKQDYDAKEKQENLCPKCGKPYKPGSINCSICNEILIEQGGLKCPNCKTINPPGAISCINCNRDMPVTGMSDITPKDLGIEVEGGTMRVILEKGTPYPTEDPFSKEFYTPAAGMRRLEIPVYEGSAPMATQNELIGIITMELPNGMTKGTPVNVAFGLDKDRTITISVKLRSGGGQVKDARLQHGLIDPELRKRVISERDALTRFIDRWQEELTDAEYRDLMSTLALLDQGINEDVSKLKIPVQTMLQQVAYKTQLATNGRGSDAFNSAVIRAGSKYMKPQEVQPFEQIGRDFDQARDRADWAAIDAIIKRADQAVNGLSAGILVIVHLRTLADQDKISPAMQNKVYPILTRLDQAWDKNDGDGVKTALDELFNIMDAVFDDAKRMGNPPIGPVKLSDKK